LPNLAVVALLVGLACWGHHTGWTLPRLADFTGNGAPARDDWCDEHAVPQSQCVECNPSLAPPIKHHGWCDKHGVHNCPLEHPDIVQVGGAAKVTQEDFDRADRALQFKDWPENHEGCKKYHRLLQFASDAVFNKMGVGVMPVLAKPIIETIPASGELTFEPPRQAPVHTAVPGRVWQLTNKGVLGAAVKKGDVLALIDAAEVGKAKVEYLQAHAQLEYRKQVSERTAKGWSEGTVSVARFLEVEAALREGQIRLLATQQALANLGLPIRAEEVKDLSPEQLAAHVQCLGLPPHIVKQVDAGKTANLLPIRAPRNGTVIDVRATEWEVVDAARTLFVVADTTRLWLMLTVRQEDAKYLRPRVLGARSEQVLFEGQTVLFKPDGGGAEVQGRLVWKSSVVDEKTRTLRFAAEVANDHGLLAAHTFGTARIVIREEKEAVVVPSVAIHWEGDCHVVFVRDKHWFKSGAPKVFHVRTVRPGVKNGQDTEIIAGLLPGEVVASTNSAVLRAELLKTNLGAG
jgi:cobalt-zinc-cadmium efflux system membrane fusion protein